MKHRNPNRALLFSTMLAMAMPGIAPGQAGPQDRWVIEPDLKFGSAGSGSGQLSMPRSIAIDSNFLYVADHYNDRIQVFVKNGLYTNSFFGLSRPSGIAVDGTHVYVSDSGNSRVRVFSKNGTFVRMWGSQGSGPGQFKGGGLTAFESPSGIAVDADSVYVVDLGNNRIQVFSKDGIFVRQWGSFGTVAGQFNAPESVAVDQQYVYVADALNYRVQVFKKDGTYVRAWQLPVATAWNGNAIFVEGMSLDAHCVYVCFGFNPGTSSAWTPHIIAYDKFGTMLWKWTNSSSTGPFTYPSGIAIDNPFMYVVDYGGNFVQPFRRVFRTLGPLEPDPIPLTDIVSVSQRSGTAVLDVDYLAADENDSNVTVYAAAFVTETTNAVPSLNDIIPMRAFLEGTSSNIGPGIATGAVHRLSWDMDADGVTNRIAQYGDLKVALMARDQRDLLDLHFLSIPALGTNAALTINRAPLHEADFLPVWFWWLAAGDSNVALNAGQVLGVGGDFDGQLLAQGTNTTAAGRAFLFSRMNLREATADELRRAREGTTPGTVLQWTPRREPPAPGSKVNAINFVTSPTNGWWVVPLP
ncbi:MAG: hypothetical protein IT577_19370 [Verrucomicrobiae bacterium]|nr:hypothetical protein [Verrucomicrobiae bacterium]